MEGAQIAQVLSACPDNAAVDAFASEWEEPSVGLESSHDISFPSYTTQFTPGGFVARLPHEHAAKPSRLHLDAQSESVHDNTNDTSTVITSLTARSESSIPTTQTLPPSVIMKSRDSSVQSDVILNPETTDDTEEWDTASVSTEAPPGISGISVMCSAAVHEESRPGSYAVASACSTDTKISDRPTALRFNFALDGFLAGSDRKIRASDKSLGSHMQPQVPLELPAPGVRWETSTVYNVRAAAGGPELERFVYGHFGELFEVFGASKRPKHSKHYKPCIEVPVPDVSMPLPAMVPGLEGICFPCDAVLPENEVPALRNAVQSVSGKGPSSARHGEAEQNCKSQRKLEPMTEESQDDLMWA